MGGYVYVIGGDNNSNAYQIDVWRAPESDLTSWTRMTANWGVGNRVLYAVWARGTALYIGGGQTLREFTGEAVQVYYDDVWRSDNNGATWTQIATGTPLASHGACGVADWQGRTWFIAGGKYKVQFTRDVHSTADGITFTAHTAPPFDKRYYTDAAVVDGELVLFGGYSNTSQYGEPGGSDASGLVGYNRADLWRTRDGELWTRNPSELGTAAALLSHASGVVGIDKKLIVAAGNHLTKEVWKHAEAA